MMRSSTANAALVRGRTPPVWATDASATPTVEYLVTMPSSKEEHSSGAFAAVKAPQRVHPVFASTSKSDTSYSHEFELRQRAALARCLQQLFTTCGALGFAGRYFGRLKSLVSIRRKMREREIGYSEVFDKIGARVIVENIPECYRLLEAINARYLHCNARASDYILYPKPNGYQSLHASISFDDDWLIEIQIRTAAMHEVSERGTASHITYKATGASNHLPRASQLLLAETR